jgi:diguanylate cyclase (GGDEF)-like protein/PAS domain S-box-containing protein
VTAPPSLDDAIAARTSVALLVLTPEGGEPAWLNESARRLVAAHGGRWDGPGSPAALLRGVGPGAVRATVRWPSPVGGTRWWRVDCRSLGEEARLLYEITDETGRHDDGRTDQWRFSRIEAIAGLGSWDWDPLDGRLLWSPALLQMFGLPPDHVMTHAEFRGMVHPADIHVIDEAMAQALRTCGPFSYTNRAVLHDGTERVFECFGEVVPDASGAPLRVLGCTRDVTDQHRARAELAYLAHHDPLTGVANRRRMTARLAECSQASGAVLLLLDVDRFKDVNDLRGHAVGDAVMTMLARVVTARLPDGALLGRLGGDEFAVIVPGADEEAGRALAEGLCAAVAREPVEATSPPLRVTVSIGVARLDPGQPGETALAHADLALYAAKAAGRNRAQVFVADQYDRAVHRVSVLQRVESALEGGMLALDAQPIVDLRSGAVTRHEALLRLRDGLEPALGPADFLPAAERTDLILRVDRWVLTRAIAALATPRSRARQVRLEVNVSGRSVRDAEIGPWILDELARARVAPWRLGLEITETAAVDCMDAARDLATTLIEAGCGFALDDFGAGFGSFSYLKNLRFTSVKIGGDFVQQIDDDRVDRALVTAVVGVGRQLGMTTVAEQIDRPPLVSLLRSLGVDHGQGYHLGRPQPLDTLVGMV